MSGTSPPGAAVPPPAGALEQVRRLAGASATIDSVVELEGGQHAATWRVDTASPPLTVVVRQFPPGDPAAASEVHVLRALEGLDGMAPVLLGSDLAGLWSQRPTTLISWLDGDPDIAPADPDAWAAQLGHTLAAVHAVPGERLSALPSLFEGRGGALEYLAGPLAPCIRSAWPQITAAPQVLTHTDYWSGNVVWRDGVLAGIVDWSGAALGPRGYDVGWCRLDLYLLFDERLADVFLAAYEQAAGDPLADIALWDRWALARSHEIIETWDANYRPLGRADLDAEELRRRHSQWTSALQDQRWEPAQQHMSDADSEPDRAWWPQAQWQRMRAGEDCPICIEAPLPRNEHGEMISQSAFTFTHLNANQAHAGYSVVILRRHAPELHDLSDQELAGFWSDVAAVGRVIAALFEPVKICDLVMGGRCPHVHCHVFPLYADDDPQAMPDIHDGQLILAAAEQRRRVEAMRAVLDAGGARASRPAR